MALRGFLVIAFIINLHGIDFVQAAYNANQPYRTSFHFQPPKNWMNDPCGPMLYKGIYHLFYQYNPNGVKWGPPVWAHSTSTDLINWTPQPVAIAPQMPTNIGGSWTGSTTILPGNKPVILFTGLDSRQEQVQNLAVPKNLSDPFLREWVLVAENPVMFPTPTRQINASAFRDPTTAWMLDDKQWRVLVPTQWGDRVSALLWRSNDFVHWVEARYPLFSKQDTTMWECLDFFPIDVNEHAIGANISSVGPMVRHILKISLDDTKHDVYAIGTYDFDRDLYLPESGFVANDLSLKYDYGKYYASKSFYDSSTKRRILFGWVNESSNPDDDKIKGWSGIHAIPRTISVDESGTRLVLWPIEELQTLRQNRVNLPSQVIKPGSSIEVFGVTASKADVEVSFKIPDLSNVEEFDPSWTNPQVLCSRKQAYIRGVLGPFGLQTLASGSREEYTAIFFRIFEGLDKYVVVMCSDQSKSSLNPTTDKQTYGAFVIVDPVHEELSLRILIDHSIVESFGAKGKNCITARVYPMLAINDKAKLYLFNYGTRDVEITSLTAWSMKKAQINRSEQGK